MCSPFIICGSLQNHEDEDMMDTLSPCSTPKRSRRSSGFYRNKETKNRYANLGLDKFNALLSELEEQKQKIYTQKGAEDITLIQFVISTDNEIKPIVFKTSDASSKATQNILQVSEQLKKHTENHESSSDKKLEVEETPKKKRDWSSWHILKLEKFKQPFYYLPVVVISILLFLAIYGKPFAILCTSIGWYLIASLRGGDIKLSSNGTSNERKVKRKKEHSRLLHEKTFKKTDGSSSPTSVFDGPAGISPPRQHGHRRSL